MNFAVVSPQPSCCVWSLMYTRLWLLHRAARRSAAPSPPWGSLKSICSMWTQVDFSMMFAARQDGGIGVVTPSVVLARVYLRDAGVLVLDCFRMCCPMWNTVRLSCAEDCIRWTKDCDWSVPSIRRKTTAICQDIARFPNQSCWDYLYRWGINFVAQSLIIKAESSPNVFIVSMRAWSWCADRSRCDFQECMELTDVLNR